MNFYCSSTDISSPYVDLTKHKSKNNWFIYLDKGWTKNENYFYKGFSSSWCKIYFDPIIKIESNKLRDFPIYHNKVSVTNFQQLDNIVPVDGIVEIDKEISITYQENFYPRISTKQISFKDCHEILYDALIENIGTFASSNKDPVYIPLQGGIDTLTIRSVFDYLGVDYTTFDLPASAPTLSKVGSELLKNHWAFTQVKEKDNSVIVTGFYGDEWVLRNPYYAHGLLSQRGISIIDEFDKTKDCYMKGHFETYREKCVSKSEMAVEELISQICNDFQIWHLNNTKFLSPLKHISLLNLLTADNQTIIDQVTDAKLSKSIIEKCNPSLLRLIDNRKNQSDPSYFSI